MRIAIAIFLLFIAVTRLSMDFYWLMHGKFSEKADLFSSALSGVFLIAGIALLLRFSRKVADVLGVLVCSVFFLGITWRNIRIALEALQERGAFSKGYAWDLGWVFTLFAAWAVVWLTRDLLRLKRLGESQPGPDAQVADDNAQKDV